MKTSLILGLSTLLVLANCAGSLAPKAMTPAEIKEKCEQERREAAGPTGSVTVGTNSKTGAFGDVSVTVNDKFLRGLDPDTVYSTCIDRYSAQN